jgi:uncharacterized protein (DUF1684 family)
MVVRTMLAALALAALPALAAPAPAPGSNAWGDDLAAWRAKVDKSLRRDNGWLTLVGRHVLRYGSNSVGSATGNDVVLDAAIAPPHLGVIYVGERHVRLDLAQGVSMMRDGLRFSSTPLTTDPGGAGWVSNGRLALEVIRRDDGQAVLRVADNQSPLRAKFAGRVWFDPNASLALPRRSRPTRRARRSRSSTC